MGIMGVYVQYIFHGDVDLMWVRNVQMGAFSAIFFAAKGLIFNYEGCPLVLNFHTIAMACMQANLGLLSALMILHCGAVEKSIASAGSILLTNSWEHAVFQHTAPSLLEIIF